MTRRHSALAARRAAAGFTLIEILVVLVLIGIVVGAIATNINKNRQKAMWQAAKAQVQSLSMKIEEYALDNGTPPERLEDLVQQPGAAKNWNGPYAKESQIKDPWGRDFSYRYPGENGDYDLISFGADGREGGDGTAKDLNNWE